MMGEPSAGSIKKDGKARVVDTGGEQVSMGDHSAITVLVAKGELQA